MVLNIKLSEKKLYTFDICCYMKKNSSDLILPVRNSQLQHFAKLP